MPCRRRLKEWNRSARLLLVFLCEGFCCRERRRGGGGGISSTYSVCTFKDISIQKMGMASSVYVSYRKNIIDVVCWITGFPKNGIASGIFSLYITFLK